MRTAPSLACLQIALALSALAAVVTPADAQNRYGTQGSIDLYLAENAPCGPDGGAEGQKFFAIIDADAVDDCDEEGGGDVLAWCACDDGTRRSTQAAVDSPDLTEYALLAGRVSGQTLKGFTEPNKPRLVLGDTTASLIGDGEFAAGVFIAGPIAKLESDTGIGQRNGVEVGSNYINFSLNGISGVVALDGTTFRLALVPVIPSGDSPPTCDSALVTGPEAKALYIDNTTGAGTLCMCNGSSWSVLAPAGGSCG